MEFKRTEQLFKFCLSTLTLFLVVKIDIAMK